MPDPVNYLAMMPDSNRFLESIRLGASIAASKPSDLERQKMAQDISQSEQRFPLELQSKQALIDQTRQQIEQGKELFPLDLQSRQALIERTQQQIAQDREQFPLEQKKRELVNEFDTLRLKQAELQNQAYTETVQMNKELNDDPSKIGDIAFVDRFSRLSALAREPELNKQIVDRYSSLSELQKDRNFKILSGVVSAVKSLKPEDALKFFNDHYEAAAKSDPQFAMTMKNWYDASGGDPAQMALQGSSVLASVDPKRFEIMAKGLQEMNKAVSGGDPLTRDQKIKNEISLMDKAREANKPYTANVDAAKQIDSLYQQANEIASSNKVKNSQSLKQSLKATDLSMLKLALRMVAPENVTGDDVVTYRGNNIYDRLSQLDKRLLESKNIAILTDYERKELYDISKILRTNALRNIDRNNKTFGDIAERQNLDPRNVVTSPGSSESETSTSKKPLSISGLPKGVIVREK